MKTINNIKKLKKWIIGAILGLFLSFGIFTSSVKPKATIITLTPIVDINDLPNGAKIVFNQTLTNFSTQYWGMAEVFVSSGNGTGFYYNTTTWNKGQFILNKTSGIYFRGNKIYDWTNGWQSGYTTRTFYVSAEQINFYNSSGNVIDSTTAEFINWINANTTITYEVTEDPTEITLNANGGYFVDSGTGDELTTKTISFYGSQTTTSEAITNALIGSSLEYPNHTFLGWGTSSSSATTLTTSELNALETGSTIYAIWRDDNYITITYEKNPNLAIANYTGTTPSAQNVLKNSTYTPLGNTGSLAYPHYHFIGWNTDEYATTGLSSVEVVTSDITLYSIFEIDQHTLTLNLGGGDLPGYTTNTFNYNYGTTVNLATFGTPVKTSYIFLGWGTSSTATEFITNVTMTTNKTVYAIWGTATQDFATITFNGNGNTGGAVPGSVTVIKGTTYTLPFNPGELVKTGYTFLGWSLASDSLTTFETVTPTTNITVYAVWAELQYANIILKINSETIATCKVYNLGYATYYIKFGEFGTEYFKINITAQDGFTADNINYNWLWSVYYNASNHNATITYTFNGDHVTQINFTNNSGETTEYDAAALDLMRPPNTLLVYYENSATYTIDIITTPNTEIDNMRTIIGGIASSMQALLDINIGWFSLGALVAVVISIGVLFFVFKIARGGGNG